VSEKKYFALLSTETFMGQFWQKRRKLATVGLYKLWLLTLMFKTPVTSVYTAHVYQLEKIKVLLNCIAKSPLLTSAVTTYAVARSRERKRRLARWASEVTNQDITKGILPEIQNIFFGLVVIFMSNYTLIYILDIYGEVSSIFKQIYLETASIESSFVKNVSSFLSPILI
jgi:hypothetical protein